MSDSDDGYRIDLIFEDPTPNGLINHRIMLPFCLHFEQTDLSLLEREQFTFISAVLGKKLVAVWRHREAYREIERKLIAEAEKATRHCDGPGPSQDLFLEFDEFLVQIKSALDVMVKIPVPILGRNVWNVRRFGAKGKDVLNAMQHCVPNKYADRMAVLRDYTFGRNSDWLDVIIEARDKINHFLHGGVSFMDFSVRKLKDERGERVIVPMWSPEQTINDAMSVVWRRLLCFVEEFVGYFFFLRLKPDWAFAHRHLEGEDIEQRWKVAPMGYFDAITGKAGGDPA